MEKVKNPLWLRHFQYGHLNFGCLMILQRKSKMMGIPVVPSQVCDECGLCKQYYSRFSKSKSWRANRVLGMIYFDICPPITPISIRVCILLCLSMIFLGTLGCIFCKKSYRVLLYLKPSKHG